MRRVENISRTLGVGEKVRVSADYLPKHLRQYAGREGIVREIVHDCCYQSCLNRCPANTSYVICPGKLSVSGVYSSQPSIAECWGYGTFALRRVNK